MFPSEVQDGRWVERFQGPDVISSKNDLINQHQEEEINQRYIAQLLSSVLMGGASTAAPAKTSTYTVTIPTSFTFVSIVVTSKVPNFCLH